MLVIMALACLGGAGLHRARMVPPEQTKFTLEGLVPARFGGWELEPDDLPIRPSRDLQAAIDRAYEQTLDRAYVDAHGSRIMLSIAYSGNYNKGMQWHRPENCYPSQGFTIETPTTPISLATAGGRVEAAQLVARRGARVEPITYWFVLGDRQARFGFDLRWHQVLYGLTGRVPDGLLIRISSIDDDVADAFSLEEAFARELVGAIPASDRRRFLGAASGHSG